MLMRAILMKLHPLLTATSKLRYDKDCDGKGSEAVHGAGWFISGVKPLLAAGHDLDDDGACQAYANRPDFQTRGVDSFIPPVNGDWIVACFDISPSADLFMKFIGRYIRIEPKCTTSLERANTNEPPVAVAGVRKQPKYAYSWSKWTDPRSGCGGVKRERYYQGHCNAYPGCTCEGTVQPNTSVPQREFQEQCPPSPQTLLFAGMVNDTDCGLYPYFNGLWCLEGYTLDSRAYYSKDIQHLRLGTPKLYLYYDAQCDYPAQPGSHVQPWWIISSAKPSLTRTHNLDGNGAGCQGLSWSNIDVPVTDPDRQLWTPPKRALWEHKCGTSTNFTPSYCTLTLVEESTPRPPPHSPATTSTTPPLPTTTPTKNAHTSPSPSPSVPSASQTSTAVILETVIPTCIGTAVIFLVAFAAVQRARRRRIARHLYGGLVLSKNALFVGKQDDGRTDDDEMAPYDVTDASVPLFEMQTVRDVASARDGGNRGLGLTNARDGSRTTATSSTGVNNTNSGDSQDVDGYLRVRPQSNARHYTNQESVPSSAPASGGSSHVLLTSVPPLSRYELPRSALILLEKLETGAFGEVFKATATLPSGARTVAAKCVCVASLNDGRRAVTHAEREALLAECLLLSSFIGHANIVQFLGCCGSEITNANSSTDDLCEEVTWLVMEYVTSLLPPSTSFFC